MYTGALIYLCIGVLVIVGVLMEFNDMGFSLEKLYPSIPYAVWEWFSYHPGWYILCLIVVFCTSVILWPYVLIRALKRIDDNNRGF